MKTPVKFSLVAVATLALAGSCFADSVSPRSSAQTEARTVALYTPSASVHCPKCAKADAVSAQQVNYRATGHGQSIALFSR